MYGDIPELNICKKTCIQQFHQQTLTHVIPDGEQSLTGTFAFNHTALVRKQARACTRSATMRSNTGQSRNRDHIASRLKDRNLLSVAYWGP